MSEPFSYNYSRLVAGVYVTETRDGRYQVTIDNPFASRNNPFAVKVFKRGDDPSDWIGKQLAKVMPKLVAELHEVRNDDWKHKPDPEPEIDSDWYVARPWPSYDDWAEW